MVKNYSMDASLPYPLQWQMQKNAEYFNKKNFTLSKNNEILREQLRNVRQGDRISNFLLREQLRNVRQGNRIFNFFKGLGRFLKLIK